MAAGYDGILGLSGVWIPKAPPPPGFVGIHQLCGVWITGAPNPLEYRGKRRRHDYPEPEPLWPSHELLLREDEEIISIIIAACESGVLL